MFSNLLKRCCLPINKRSTAPLTTSIVAGYARYIAICPPDWRYGVSVGQIPESPLQLADKPLHWDKKLGVRVR